MGREGLSRLRAMRAWDDGPLQLLDLFDIRTNAPVQVVRVGVPQGGADLDRDPANL